MTKYENLVQEKNDLINSKIRYINSLKIVPILIIISSVFAMFSFDKYPSPKSAGLLFGTIMLCSVYFAFIGLLWLMCGFFTVTNKKKLKICG